MHRYGGGQSLDGTVDSDLEDKLLNLNDDDDLVTASVYETTILPVFTSLEGLWVSRQPPVTIMSIAPYHCPRGVGCQATSLMKYANVRTFRRLQREYEGRRRAST